MKTTRPSIYPIWLLAFLFAAAAVSASARAQVTTSPAKPQAATTNVAALSAARSNEQNEEAAAPTGKDASHEGITLHGHWTIDVKNADGTIASHSDFQNAITLDGKMFLLSLLNGAVVPGDYMIEMFNSNGNGPCSSPANTCGIVRTLSTYPGSSYCIQSNDLCATTLTRNLAFSGSSATLTFAGSITANQAGSINVVQLSLGTCGPIPATNALNTTSPASCPSPTSGPFRNLTATNPAAIGVNNTQIIQVTIVLTLS